MEELERLTKEGALPNATFTCMERLETVIVEAETFGLLKEDLQKPETVLQQLQEQMEKVWSFVSAVIRLKMMKILYVL